MEDGAQTKTSLAPISHKSTVLNSTTDTGRTVNSQEGYAVWDDLLLVMRFDYAIG